MASNKLTGINLKKIFFATLVVFSVFNIGSTNAQGARGTEQGARRAEQGAQASQSATGGPKIEAETVDQQDIDLFLAKRPPIEQVNGYFKLVQRSVRDLGELEELLKGTNEEPNLAIRQMKVTNIQLRIAEEKARLEFRRNQLDRAEKLYGNGTASARTAKLLRAGGSSLKALPAIGLGAGVIFATGASADQTSATRAASMNADGPTPIRLEKSNIGSSDLDELEAAGGRQSENIETSTDQDARKRPSVRITK